MNPSASPLMPLAALNRRSALGLLAAITASAGIPTAMAEPTAEQMARNKFVRSLPVLPWAKLAETTYNEVQAPIQAIKTQLGGMLLIDGGSSAETSGTFINLSTAAKTGLLNEPGLQFLTLDFDENRRLQMVTLRFDRGWKDKNINPLIERTTRRYGNLANPTVLGDPESEATDRAILYEIGKFVVELRIPQHGTYLTATFTTKSILRRLRSMDGTIEIYKDYLDR